MRVDLPPPSPDELAHSERVAALIRGEIDAAGGALDFARYMELALYAPGLGYYSAGAAKFGAAGDFVTAPELGFVFARCLARALAPVLRETHGDILELGPGSGALAAELLVELERLDALPQRYRLLERSADLRQRQQMRILQHSPHLESRCEWLDAPPAQAWRGALIANEVIDALPVRLFALHNGDVFERRVGIDDDWQFVWSECRADESLRAAVAKIIPDATSLLQPYSSEICTMLAPWFAEITRQMQNGTALFIDYGYAQAEYYSPQRAHGTLRCHYRHRAHANPLILPGLQDITAHVDFDALIKAGGARGFKTVAFETQAQFLVQHGLDEVFADAYANAADETARYALAQQVKRLTLPGQMGDAFRVSALRR
ncbi:MAG: class I SAM-dependent methyltransferase [Xanthomonadales bacterium PRO7]|nr:class I SAM-dependent methyltransferase [Xanthomonadales bacterium PRO7]